MKDKKLKLILVLAALCFLLPAALYAAEDITGLWKTIDDETGNPKAVIAVYEYGGKIYGRVICSYDEFGKELEDDIYQQKKRSPYLVGEPAFNGLDIIWDMKDKGKKWSGGKIMDPGDDEGKKPAIYDCDMWKEDRKLVVRGKIFFFGRNQTWLPFNKYEFPSNFRVPDWKNFRPSIPKIK